MLSESSEAAFGRQVEGGGAVGSRPRPPQDSLAPGVSVVGKAGEKLKLAQLYPHVDDGASPPH